MNYYYALDDENFYGADSEEQTSPLNQEVDFASCFRAAAGRTRMVALLPGGLAHGARDEKEFYWVVAGAPKAQA
jgi:hypothetical protein